ncbi:MAG: CPBP family glutamic-type intramembrane protease [Pelistega sp.]|nr:CPBP family glutamic-type intramembrane protease [Pelistega sp.]
MSSQLTFKNDLKAFWAYIIRPSFGPRLAHNRRGDGWWSDLKVHTPFKLLLKWAFFLWLLNIGLLAPIAIGVAESLGAKHRISLDIPYLFLLAAIWAPIVEELLFRFGLRRPKLILIYVPLMIYVMHNGPNIVSLGIVVLLSFLLILFDLLRQTDERFALPFAWRRYYRQWFPLVFHASVFSFAAMHLMNYQFGDSMTWLVPLLILPQWLTGLVVAWMRMRDSMACAVVMHAIFNGGPILLMLLLMQLLPEQVLTT